MISYHVYLKDYKAKEKLLLGVLPERRKIPRNQTATEAGLKWAKKMYHNIISDPQAIFISIEQEEKETKCFACGNYFIAKNCYEPYDCPICHSARGGD